MVTALYRRYRPETFAEMIGQSQVTDPLMTALRTNRVNHAYLFSGPRGCGKTTSARILARCLNCAEGPTDTPCGVCPSCVELARDGGGSLDVVEIDAASHNGVDDARDIRERAIFAPARDRYKIFILDEAHMVTPQGFNALLKIVEEPPEHVKFIFATTEPEKVIGTIRSRTHHYPFRLVPPGPMLEYVQQMCDTEKMVVAPGVLPLVVRAGGGSPRDTLSLLDQLMAGSDGQSIEYERAVALLGYTSASLLDEAVDAIGARDSSAAFDAVDRVIQTGQDPRRFVEDLLERMRDLIIVAATSVAGAAAVLRGVPQDELERMSGQAAAFGPAELSRTADILNAALTEMSGATSPRLHLELMIARALIPATDDSTRGALARVERLERRIGVDGVAAAAAPNAAPAAAPGALAAAVPAGAPAGRPAAVAASAGARGSAVAPASVGAARPAAAPASAPDPLVEPVETAIPGTQAASATQPSPASIVPGAPVTLQQLKDAWPEILEVVKNEKTTAWLVVYTAHVLGLNGDVLALSFPSQADVDSFKQQKVPGMGTSDFLRTAIVAVLGLRVKFIARVEVGREASSSSTSSDGSPTVAAEPAPAVPAATEPAPPAADAVSSAARNAEAADSQSPSTAATAPTVTAPTVTAPTVTAPAVSAVTVTVPTVSRTAPAPPAAARVTAPSAAAGASTVAASTSGWATVAIPGSPNGPALPVVDDDTTAAASLDPALPEADAATVPESLSSVPAHSTGAGASGGAASDEPWAATVFVPQSLTEPQSLDSQSADEPPFDDVPPPFDDDVPPEMDAPADERVPNYEAQAEASAVPSNAVPSNAVSSNAVPSNAVSSNAGSSNAVSSNAGASAAFSTDAQPSRQSPGAPQHNPGQQQAGAQTDPAQRQHPNASAQRGATKDPSRAPSFAEKQRYGEAVVREILGATFIEEQPYSAAPRTRNDY
ncbi:DNA polymerase III subunit gamma and tau [Cryobacterium sp. PH31-L1]|uniref:DNA polymerase III subunit gamma and tau n=1 Tax=Cryobacterium sp. PH31-L1 TaxID=3046199 RepID=UPI0024BA3391|nr:DNA polymerase III subunit gamma and tau [Cryobacterium sp. PH31-L1]MDJ0376921.1 DNA polymerase III subunit gamma and tau [Cryobacterium sp. PH31-L1]